MTPSAKLRARLPRNLPIFHRVLLGNSAVIVIGAIVGTLLTHQLSQRQAAAEWWLIGLFVAAGILLSLAVNYRIVKTALQPLRALREAVDRVEAGHTGRRAMLTSDADPDITRLAEAIGSMLERLEGHTLQLRALSERAITAQEEERKRIARGLHDDTNQALSMLIISLERIEHSLPDSPELAEPRQRLAQARQLATRTLEELRKVVYDLRPTMLDDLGLGPAIRWYARSTLEEAGIQVGFDALDDTVRLPPQIETALFRVTQEAINNIVRHAGAKSVTVGLSRRDGQVCLRVEDDGRGFEVAQITGQSLRLRRLGLLGIQERVDLIGGQVTLDSAPGRGTRLRVCVPHFGREGEEDGKDQNPAGR